MSNIDKQALRERYSPKPVPKCHICGEEMTIQRMSASRITYGCTGATYDDKGCHYAEGRSIADDHYEQSRVTVVDVSDPDVLALLDELEHYKSREERVTKLVLDNSTSWDVLYEKLEAAERRIANNERVMRAVVEAASIRGIRPFEGIECDPPTLEENAEACGDAMSARIRELEANPPKPHHNGLMQISNELVQARQRIAELEKGHQEAAKQINSWRRLAKQNIAERGKDISELEAARQRIAELEDAQCQHESDTLMLCHQFDELASAMGWTSELAMKQGVGQLEYARSIKARIAELEARTVNLSKLSVGEVMHLSGFSRDYAEGWCAGNDNAIHEIRAAGIKVNGE